MTQIKVCDQCGKRLEIEDFNNLDPMEDLIPPENELLHENIVCENCAHYHLVEKS